MLLLVWLKTSLNQGSRIVWICWIVVGDRSRDEFPCSDGQALCDTRTIMFTEQCSRAFRRV